MKFKKHIACLFDNNLERLRLEFLCDDIFEYDPEAEIRIHIKGQVYFIQITDME